MRKQAILCHYARDVRKVIEWLPDDVSVKVYSKGPMPPEGAVRLRNVGYEAQTWFHHFATHYDELAEVTICLQDYPFNHFKTDYEKNLIWSQIAAINPDDFSFLPLSSIVNGAIQGRDGSPQFPAFAPDIEKLWWQLLRCPPPDRWHCWYNSHFAVHRDTVRRRPREFWEKGASIVKTRKAACVVERMWGHIFA